MIKTLIVLCVLLSTACELVPPTAPTPITVAPPARVATQLVVRIIGPDNWWTDKLFVGVVVYDQNGAETPAIVTCDSTHGIFEPRQFSTASWGGVPIKGVIIGATITCSSGNIKDKHVVSQIDWRVLPGGGGNTPAPRPPPPTPTPPTTPPGSGT